MSGRARPALRAPFVLVSPNWRRKGSRSSGWLRTRAVRLRAALLGFHSRVYILVFPWPYKHKMSGTRPLAFVFFLVKSCFRETAGGGARTHTILRSLDFESSASANSATPAFHSDTSFYEAKQRLL